MSTQTADHTDIRATNLAAVLGHLRRAAPCSRAAIAAGTGLNKATVTSIVGDLLDRRLVRETQQTQNHVGRPATLLVLDGSAYATIGLEVSGRGLTALGCDAAGEQVLRWHRAGPGGNAGPGRTISALAALARRAITTVQASGRQVLGISVGVPGLVDRDGAVVLAAGLGWRDVPLRAELASALGRPDIPVTVDNDASLAVLAEHLYGPLAGTANLIQVTGDTGVGAGIIADGRPLSGHRGYVGEIGHLRLVADGPACGCGRRGCLEALASLPAILSRIDGLDEGDPQLQLDQLIQRAQAADATVTKVLAEAGSHLGHGIAALVNTLNPEVVVLGGAYALLADQLVPAVDKALRDATIAPDAGGCRLAVSSFPQTATPLGATAQALSPLTQGRLPRP
ncbi:putative NBD/HSP70 family sugar kinase [Kribbella aluminosa]|uniref:NBD/HSP70 family sugar kinase n=1 Tax=Kribbella aluminosa TaxID=416017 RepID=A0ABS4UKR0_9ACTN|nr:ROK family transcriptional regulator [Kribbella aluminosa]MBP2352136.1 putative NBD/HSP70 family sugar kinase [Kribbella aluminosa]